MKNVSLLTSLNTNNRYEISRFISANEKTKVAQEISHLVQEKKQEIQENPTLKEALLFAIERLLLNHENRHNYTFGSLGVVYFSLLSI